jgi:hypothetical protein
MNFLDKNNGKVNSTDNLGFNNLDLNKFKGLNFRNYIKKLSKNKINRIFNEFSRSEKIFDDVNVT